MTTQRERSLARAIERLSSRDFWNLVYGMSCHDSDRWRMQDVLLRYAKKHSGAEEVAKETTP